MDLELQGRTVLVTGGSKGIGWACAQAFAAAGCKLVLAARDAAALSQRAAALERDFGIAVRTHALDLRDRQQRRALAEHCANVDILVNNAGDISMGSVEAIDDEAWRHAWELKVFGTIDLTRALLPSLRARGGGVIVNVIGMSALNPTYDYACGATANAALHAFTRAVGMGSKAFGVRVVGVLPPATRTERLQTVMKQLALARYGDESQTERLLQDRVWPQPIEPAQVADSVIWLASARASHLSGVILNLGS
ncbi:MAG TPA: short-chain dehydrogenase/reductase [Ramlibacter sp.]|nr:short-chain dehydrogenase/reductase [Ramlibacter sp.]